MTDIFISYSRRDQTFVRGLHDSLVTDGRDVWVDWESIPLTADWFQEIKVGIEGADAFIFVISPDSVRSEVCAAEIEHAINLNKRFVPVLYRDLVEAHDKAALHPKISSHNWTFMRNDSELQENLNLLKSALDTDLAHARIHTRILTRALEWDHRGRDTSFVLRGNDLKEAERWLEDVEGKEPEVNEIQVEYVQASRVAENWRKRERLLMMTITIAFVIAIITSVLAFSQAVEAKNQRDEAEHQRSIAVQQSLRAQQLSLAANAKVALTNNNTDLSIALALEANEDEGAVQSSETERALADAIYSPGTVRSFAGHESQVYAVAFGSLGQTAVSADSKGNIILWTVATGAEIRRFEGFAQRVNAVDVSPENKYVVGGACGNFDDSNICNGGTIILWDFETGAEIRRFEGHENEITTLEFSPEGDKLLSGSSDQTVRLWDVETGEQIGIYRRHLGSIMDVTFNPADNTQALVIAIDTPPILWNLETGREITRYTDHDVKNEPNLAVGSAAFSPDGSIIVGSFGLDIRIWRTESGDLLHQLIGHGSYVNSIAISPDGKFFISSAWRENSFRVWDIEHGVETRRFEGHTGVLRGVTISPVQNGRYALSASDDGTVRVWDLANGAEVRTLAGHTADVYSTLYSPDGKLIVSAGDDDVIRLWDAETGEQVRVLTGHTADVWLAVFTPDGTKLVSASEDNTARVWDLATGDQLRVIRGHENWVTTVAVSPDGTKILTGSNDTTIRLWDINTGRQLKSYAGDDGQLRSVLFSPDGTRFASGADTARLFDLETGEVIWQFSGHKSRINSLAYSSDGKLIATGSADATIRILDAETGKTINVFEGHSGQVRSVMFDALNETLLSSSADATLRLWSLKSGLEIRLFVGHEVWVNQASFSPDGNYAASGSWDDTIKIWHIHNVGEMIEWTQENRFVRALTCNEERIYLLSNADCGDE